MKMMNKIDKLFNKKKVIVSVQHGLGNRLRALASARLLAESIGRKFILAWVPDNHCEARYTDLFEPEFKYIEKNPTNDPKKYDIYNYMDSEFLNIPGVQNERNKRIEYKTKNDILIYSAYTLVHDYANYNKESQIIKNMKVRKELQDIIDNYDVSDMIGVHVRMEGGVGYDNLSYELPNNWDKDGLEKLRYWRGKSHYNVFMKKMDSILKENPDQKFFLCTDRKENYEVFLKNYGDKITYVERDVYDRSKEQIQYALIDMVLLSKTKFILGSSWSTFTETAVRLGRKKALMSGVDF